MKGYISVCEASYKWNVSEPGVNQYCQEGRIAGLSRFGKLWCILEDTKKPTDPRKEEQTHGNGSGTP